MGVETASEVTSLLLVSAGSQLCAVPIEHVVEIMRPLDAAPMAGMPKFLLGIAIIRGSPVPVVSLGEILGVRGEIAIERYVLVVLGNRKIAIAVEKVLDVVRVEGSFLQRLPNLLKEFDREFLANVGVKDERLFVVLEVTRIITDEMWKNLRITTMR